MVGLAMLKKVKSLDKECVFFADELGNEKAFTESGKSR